MVHVVVAVFLVAATQSSEIDSSELSMVQRRSWEKKQDHLFASDYEALNSANQPDSASSQSFQAVLQGLMVQAMELQGQIMAELPNILASLGAAVEAMGQRMNPENAGSEYTIRSGNAYIESNATVSTHVMTTSEKKLVSSVEKFLFRSFNRSAKVLLLLDKEARGEGKDTEALLHEFRRVRKASRALDAVLRQEIAERKETLMKQDPGGLPPPPPDVRDSGAPPSDIPPPPPPDRHEEEFHTFDDDEGPPHPTDAGFQGGFAAYIQGLVAQAMQIAGSSCSGDCLSKTVERILQSIGAGVEAIGKFANDRWYGGISESKYTLRAGNAYHEGENGGDLFENGRKFLIGYYRRGAAMLVVLDKTMKGEIKDPMKVMSYIARHQKLNANLDAALQRNIV